MLKAKKSLGQHFLNSKSVLDKIISVADIIPEELILEIGPGTGVLTKELINAGAKVIAVEKDSRISEDNLPNHKNLHLISSDILECNIDALFEESIKKFGLDETIQKKYKLIANIPYYITGAILEKFLEHEPRPTKIVILVQKEVAERAVTRDGKESILSISIKAFGDPKMVSKVPKGAFTPPPNVDSAIFEIDNISDKNFKEYDVSIRNFFTVVKAGFAHKRKFLMSNLDTIMKGSDGKQKISEIFTKLGLNPKIRAEETSIYDWFRLTKHIFS